MNSPVERVLTHSLESKKGKLKGDLSKDKDER